MFFVLAYDIMIPMWNISNSNIHVFIPWHLVRSILGRRLELQGTLGLISWSGRTMAYTWMSSILSELSQITRESFTFLISSSWNGKIYESSFPSIRRIKIDLLKSEGGRPTTVLVPEPIAQSVVVELFPYNARQGGTNLHKYG